MSRIDCSHTELMRAMPSMCDENSLLSIPAILDMFQDVAGIHAESAGIGALDLEERGLFWIVSKIRLKVNRRPQVQEILEATTWIQPAERVSCERDWSLSKDGEQLAYVTYGRRSEETASDPVTWLISIRMQTLTWRRPMTDLSPGWAKTSAEQSLLENTGYAPWI